MLCKRRKGLHIQSFPYLLSLLLQGWLFLVPNSTRNFNGSRLPLVKDVNWTTPGAQFILKWAKNTQAADAFRILQISKLPDKQLCPVRAPKSNNIRLQ